MAAAGSRSSAPSVISSHSRSAGNPVSASTDDHESQKPGLGQLLGRDVDRHRRQRAAASGGGPAADPAARPGGSASRSTHGAEVDHQAALLGQVDELRRRQEAARRVLPPHQRLGADRP